jgi:uncharacterized delta-60 repeat protein
MQMKKTFILFAFWGLPFMLFAQTQGSLDATFGTNGKVVTAVTSLNDKSKDLLVQPDGKIIVGGEVSIVFGDTVYMALIRYNSNGSIDNSFGVNGKVLTNFANVSCSLKALALQPDGKIVAVGYTLDKAITANTKTDFAIVRYNANGSLDTSFDGDGRVTTDFDSAIDIAYALAIQTDGKIVVAGDSRQGLKMQSVMARYNANGSLDLSFNATGKVFTTLVSDNDYQLYTVTVLQDNNILLGKRTWSNGQYQLIATEMLKFNANGIPDLTFGTYSGRLSEVAQSPIHKVLRSGKILIASMLFNPIEGTSIQLLRYNSNGKKDSTYGNQGIIISRFPNPAVSVTDFIEQKDGRIAVLARFSTFVPGEPDSFGLVRYNYDGSLDRTFGINGKAAFKQTFQDEYYNKLTIQNDGKLVACGTHTELSNKFNFVVSRFNNLISAIKNPEKIGPLSIFPNPTKNELNIDLKGLIHANFLLKITDLTGRIVYQNNYDKSLINNTLQINIGDLMAGLYVLSITSDKEQVSQLILKN